jgi:hypothetical protein
MSITTQAVGSHSRLVQGFVDLPWKIYQHDRAWVPPLKDDLKKQMDRKKNPFHRHADVEHFVALRNGKEIVGRIAATVYPAYIERFHSQTGFFGFFESVNDPEVAEALLLTAEAWLKERGMTRASGPYNYCSTQEMGLLVDGFDTPPAVYQTHNPPYYEAFLTQHGYTPEQRVDTFAISRYDVSRLSPILLKMGDAIKEKERLSVRSLSLKRFGEDMEVVRQLFNESFANNDAVTPFQKDVYEFQIKDLKDFMTPEMVTFIEKDGKPVAFTFMVANLNEVLTALNGKIRLWDLLRLKKLLGQVRSAVLLLIGALPETHGLGIGRTLLSETFRALDQSPYEVLHTTWIHENNWSSRSLAAQWQVKRTKQYVLVGRDL